MTVDLAPDSCHMYRFWSEWLRNPNPPAALILDGRHPVKYFNATAANRYRFGLKTGYSATELSWDERNTFLDDIHAVNNSLRERQGRPMKESYQAYPSTSCDTEQCPAHYTTFIAAFHSRKLVGYIATNFCGQLAAASMILGHGDHLKNGVMLVLWAEFVRLCQSRGMSVIVYSRMSDGLEGLKYWKHSVGMRAISFHEKCSRAT